MLRLLKVIPFFVIEGCYQGPNHGAYVVSTNRVLAIALYHNDFRLTCLKINEAFPSFIGWILQPGDPNLLNNYSYIMDFMSMFLYHCDFSYLTDGILTSNAYYGCIF